MREFEHTGILQVSAAVYNHYGIKTNYPVDKDVDGWLKNNSFRCVVVCLLDAMGAQILRDYLPKEAFFNQYLAKTTSTVFPPTTTAATTALLTGKSPKENGWLGWSQYFKEVDDVVIPFLEKGNYNKNMYPNLIQNVIPTKLIYDELKEKGIGATSIGPSFDHNHPCKNYPCFLDEIVKISHNQKTQFTYAYWDDPDHTMHTHGPSSSKVNELLTQMDQETGEFVKRLDSDVGILFLADHGQIDVEHYDLKQDKELCDCFEKAPSIEPRALTFFLKKDRKEEFVELFNKKLGKYFELLTKEEVITSNLFGYNQAHPRFVGFLGDMMAIAIDKMELDYGGTLKLKGNHAGSLPEEMEIPLIMYPSNDAKR